MTDTPNVPYFPGGWNPMEKASFHAAYEAVPGVGVMITEATVNRMPGDSHRKMYRRMRKCLPDFDASLVWVYSVVDEASRDESTQTIKVHRQGNDWRVSWTTQEQE